MIQNLILSHLWIKNHKKIRLDVMRWNNTISWQRQSNKISIMMFFYRVTYGQCAITATLVYDLFGGTIHKLKVDGGGTHYFNKINGHYIDLTSDQFDLYDIPLEYVPNEVVPREYCGKNADTNRRYQLLVDFVDKWILKHKN